jgi:hypothetical protein
MRGLKLWLEEYLVMLQPPVLRDRCKVVTVVIRVSLIHVLIQHALWKKPWKNAPLSDNFVYAWKNYPTSTKLTLFGAPFPSIDGKLFCFLNSA